MSNEPVTASFEGDPPAAAATEAMRDRRELALVAVERTRTPIVVTDPRQPDNPIVLANRAFLDLTGYTSEEVVGRNCRFLQGPDTDPADMERIRRGLVDNPDHISVELLNYRKDGSTFWNQLSISPVTNEAGEVIYYFGSQIDVTERRRVEKLEATERLLLLEVDHRAINVLALVKSIVRLSRADSVAHYASAIAGRVDALARAHRLLARSGWTGVELGQLLAAGAPTEAGGRVSTRGSSVRLPAPLVQPLALVLHELMSNAAQHGALAHPDGQVVVSQAERDGHLSFDWQEVGVAAFASPSTPGFGLRILAGIIEHQLGGMVATSWGSPGFRAEIRLPSRAQPSPP